MRMSLSPLLFLLLFAPAFGQELSVSTQQLVFRLPEGGPLPKGIQFTVTSGRRWHGALSNGDMLILNPTQANGTATVTATPVGWWTARLTAGTYQGALTITDDHNLSHTVQVTFTVAARRYPKLSYPAGPRGCSDVNGLLPSNAAVCTVPDERPAGNFLPPPTGRKYVDPNFGALVRVIGATPSLHGYSTPSPVSANNRFALLSQRDASAVVDLLSGKTIQNVPLGVEGTLWDARDDNLLYFFSGTSVRKFSLATRRNEVVADYSRAPFGFQSISSGGTGEMSKDNWISFFAPKERQVCALDLNSARTYCGAIPAGLDVDYSTMSKGVDRGSGLRYLVLVPGSGPFALYAVNLAASRLDLVTRGPENLAVSNGNLDGICDAGEPCLSGGHSDTMEDSAGNQILVMAMEEQAPCGFSVYTLQFNKGAQMGLPLELGGGLKRALPLFRCGGDDVWVDYHVGCAKAAPYCVFSTTSELYNKARDPADKSPLKRTAYVGEIMVMRDNGAEVRRLAQHRSLRFLNEDSRGYWSTPRAAISRDGSYVVADSNYGMPNQQRVIVIETGFGETRISAGNAAHR